MSEQGFTVRLSARVDGYLASMEQARKATKDVGDSGVNLDRLGGKMQDVGSTLSTHVTLPLIAVGGVAVGMASNFESSFARMQGLAGVAGDEVDGLKKSVLDLAGKTATAPQQLADALYDASSAGLSTAQAMDAVSIAARASATGMGSATDVVGLIASATASYGAANIDAAKAADILTATIKAGRADPAELAGSLGRILPVAAQLGISFEQVGGATAYLSNILGDTSETVTALSGVFNKLVAPSAQGRQALIDMGGSAEELSAAVSQDGLTGALDYLREHGFDKNQQALRNVFDDTQAFNGALALLNDNSGTLAATMDATATSTGSLDTAFGLASDTAGFKMRQAWADVQVALIEAGDVILPIVSGVAGAIAHLAEIFSGLSGPVQTIVVAFLGLVAAAGPVLMIGGSLVKNFNLMKTAFEGMKASATSAGLALGAVGLVMMVATKIYSDNAEKKARLVKITNDFVDALNAERDGQKGAVDAQVMALITNQDLLDKAQALGLSTSDLAKIIKGESVPAWDALRDGAKNAAIGLDEVGKVTGLTTYVQRGHAAAVAGVSDALGPMVQALQDAIVQQQLADKVTRELTVKFGEGTTSMVEHGGAAGRVATALEDVQVATENTTYAVDHFAEVVAEADFAYRRLTGQLDEQEAWDHVNESIAEFGKKTHANAEDVRGITRDIADYVAHTDTIPAEKKTEILAVLRDGDIAEAERQLAALTVTREIYLKLTGPGAVTAAGYGSPRPGVASAGGRYVTGGSNLYSSLGEVSGPAGDEWVAPIGNQAALQSWLSDPRVSAPIAAAMPGYGWSGPSGSPSVVHNQSVNLYGGINNTMDAKAFWQQAQFALMAAA